MQRSPFSTLHVVTVKKAGSDQYYVWIFLRNKLGSYLDCLTLAQICEGFIQGFIFVSDLCGDCICTFISGCCHTFFGHVELPVK